VADWFAYAHAVQTEKNSENFGTGDVRGVIAPESSNNAKEGGALIPTIAFGIPGSTSLAIMLAAFISVGIQPGARMLTDQLHFTLAMVWVLVLSNLMATSIALGFSRAFARISFLPFYVIVPMTLLLCVVASFSAHYAWGDLVAFLSISLLGYLMKLFGWPRPPLLVAAVLGHQMETYLWISMSRYSFSWLLHPGVIVLLVLVLLTLAYPLLQKKKEGKEQGTQQKKQAWGRGGDPIFTLFYIALLGGAAYHALDWPLRGSVIILSLAGLGIPLGLVQTFLTLRAMSQATSEPQSISGNEPQNNDVGKRTAEILLWILSIIGGIWLVGFHITLPLFAFLYSKTYGARWSMAVFLGLIAEGFLVVIFDQLLSVVWPTPLLFNLLS
jgi:hypothetical protein